ncbi:transporter [Clostridium chromiireducens]|uniref:Transporter n=1 Tax=Clostridium chromiireducens TaxID=225345 RepID=A0A399IP54_9CLOT|nr:ABC transporter substrate-binding protein [Clostridium chromiireducens]RII34367.1 transporter [Clostridium chromiireducens]
MKKNKFIFNLKNFSIVVVYILILSMFIGGCSKTKNTEDKSSTEETTRVVTDMAGRKVTLPKEINRVCSNGAAQNQLMLFLGAESKIVTTLPALKSNEWVTKIFPKISNLPEPFSKEGINVEELLKAKPDVVTLWSGTEEIQKKLDEVGIPYVILFYSTNEEFKKGITLMGEILGEKESKIAKEFTEYYESNINKITSKTDKLTNEQKKRVYYVTDNPLSTEGKESIVTSWINIAGGANVAAEGGVEKISATVSMEEVIKWDPEIIIVRDYKNKDAILNDDKWKDITAVKEKQVYVNPKGVNVWSARSADGALQPLWAAKIFHPELFEDINIENEVKNFYKTYYKYEINDEELKDIMHPHK